jgi:hypothetical protein
MHKHALILPLILLTACSKQPNQTATGSDRESTDSKSAAASLSPTPTPSNTSEASPDPYAGRRYELLTRIKALADSDCDSVVLELQIIPRDEILNPISKPRNDLVSYVKHLNNDEDFALVERTVKTKEREPKREPKR